MKKFHDFNFKLMVIQELMYNQELIEPAFDVYEFADQHPELKIDPDDFYDEVIPAVKAYFEDLDIPEHLLEKIEALDVDGGDEIYLMLCPQWDGEDNLFNVKSAEDAPKLQNLKNVSIFYDEDESILEKFVEKGVEAEWV